jgi:hypothetical protein
VGRRGAAAEAIANRQSVVWQSKSVDRSKHRYRVIETLKHRMLTIIDHTMAFTDVSMLFDCPIPDCSIVDGLLPEHRERIDAGRSS